MHLDFTVPGRAVPKGRPRVFRSGHTKTPDRTVAYERKVSAAARVDALADGPLKPIPKSVAVAVEIIVYVARPKRSKGTIRPVWPATGRMGDVDNIAKSILDALSGVAYADDKQVVTLSVHRRYCAGNTEPRVRIRVWEAGRKPGMWG